MPPVNRGLKGSEENEQGEQRRGAVSKDSLNEMKPANRTDFLCQQKPHMLEVPLAPSTIAFHVFRQIRRQTFIAAVEIIGKPDFPTGVPHQRCFDEIMAQHASTQWGPPRKFR